MTAPGSAHAPGDRVPDTTLVAGYLRGAEVIGADSGGNEGMRRRELTIRRSSLVASAVLVCVGVANLAAWALGVPDVTRIPSNGQPMVPWTATCLVLMSLGLVALVRGTADRLRVAVSAITATISGFMLVEIVTSRTSSFDTLLFGSHVRRHMPILPGQMAVNTAVAFLLIAIGLATVRASGRMAWLSAATSVLGSAVGMVATLGYAAGTSELYQPGALTRMALPTALSVFLLGATIAVCGGPDSPLRLIRNDGPGGRAARWLLPTSAMAPPVMGLLERVGRQNGLYSESLVPIVLLSGLAVLMLPLAWLLASRLDEAYRIRLDAEAARMHLATIVNSTTDAILSVDLHGRVTSWNPGAKRLFGWAAGEILGRDLSVLAVPGREQDVAEKLRRVFAGERIDGVQTERMTRSGKIVEVGLSISPLRSSTGEVVGAAAICRDNTLQRRADSQFRDLVESAPDALVITDEHGLIKIVNHQTERLLGYTRHELLGSPVEVLLPIEARSRHLDHRMGFVRHPHARPMGEGLLLNARHKDGSLIPVEISLAPLQTVDGTLISAAVRDVRQRRQTEDARRLAEQRFRRVFEDSPLGMAIVDPNLQLVEANDALSALTGVPIEALERRSLRDLAIAADGELLDRTNAVLRSEGAVTKFEQRLNRAHGEPVWTSVTATGLGEGGEGADGLLIFEDITDRRTFEGRLQYLADHDALTGLFNRRRFEEELEREHHTMQRYGGSGALLLLDLDHFKYVNDTLGHAAGDELLTQVAQTLKTHVRTTDIVGRLGGDEFAVILPHATRDDAGHVAEGLLQALRSEVQMSVGERTQGATASIGIATFDDADDVPSSELFIQADIAMYDAKDAGRNGFRFYDADEARRRLMVGRLTWGERIRHALDNDGFVLLAQPIVDLSGTDPRPRSELLIRMRDEDGELIRPDAFLYLADRFGLTEELDSWVITRAIDMLKEESDAGRPTMFEINLSARSVESDRIAPLVQQRLADTGVAPELLCFEITETAAITTVDRARVFAQDLRALGCQFALDDFGAGFASFYYLKHLVFDYLKIDGEFVKGIVNSEFDQLVVRSLVQVARGLGKRTIAEYVEDDETLAMLREIGVDYAQGYRVGKPGVVRDAWRQVSGGGWVTSEGLATTEPLPSAGMGEVVQLNSRRR